MSALKTVNSQPSWEIKSDKVTAYLTRTGGHLGPVHFNVGGRSISPYSVAPWADEKLPSSVPAILRVLRGDFFCMPFGGNTTPYRGEKHPVHGEVANARWTLESLETHHDLTTLHASLQTRVRKGFVDKFITLQKGHRVLYCRHVISGMKGPMNFGHHAMLKFPDQPGSGLISTSPMIHAQTLPVPFENPEQGGYSSLKPHAPFKSLEKVPLHTGGTTDLSRYPARRGFEDLVLMVNDPRLPFAWTASVFPKQGYVWFALKDPHVLAQTVFWISNGGRHQAPWNGRHTSVMGLEEVTSYFHLGLAESAAPNLLTRKKIPTCKILHPEQCLEINYMMALAPIPAGFDHVRDIVADKGSVTLISRSGKKVRETINMSFLRHGE